NEEGHTGVGKQHVLAFRLVLMHTACGACCALFLAVINGGLSCHACTCGCAGSICFATCAFLQPYNWLPVHQHVGSGAYICMLQSRSIRCS
ncbi:hypothetical protein COO60DRAFT_1547312, partial [Scenedesmus sp. NREL 46B-D3]